MQKDFKYAYKREIQQLTYNNASKLAKEHVDQMISDITKNKLHEIATVMLEKAVKSK